LLAIIGNVRGAEDACSHEKITYLGFPFPSPKHSDAQRQLDDRRKRAAGSRIKNLCDQKNKQLVVYISMGFGNPYGDQWNAETAEMWIGRLAEMGIKIISLADTIGIANPESISYLFSSFDTRLSGSGIRAHLHTTPDSWLEKIDAAYKNGCKRFDGAIKGYGGCPMAADDLTGNMAMENISSISTTKK